MLMGGNLLWILHVAKGNWVLMSFIVKSLCNVEGSS